MNPCRDIYGLPINIAVMRDGDFTEVCPTVHRQCLDPNLVSGWREVAVQCSQHLCGGGRVVKRKHYGVAHRLHDSAPMRLRQLVRLPL